MLKAQNIALNRVSSRLGSMQRIVKDVADSEVVELALSKRFKPEEIEGAFDGGYVKFRSKGVEEHQGVVSVEQYIQRTKHHVYKVFEKMIGRGGSWKVHLQIAILFRKRDGSEETEKLIWSNPPHTIMEGTDMEEVLDEMRTFLMQQYERIINRSMIDKTHQMQFVPSVQNIYQIDIYELPLLPGNGYIVVCSCIKVASFIHYLIH